MDQFAKDANCLNESGALLPNPRSLAA